MSRKNNNDGGLVFSTEQGWDSPASNKASVVSRPDGFVRISRQTKGRKGKGVTLVAGLPYGPEQLKQMALALKKQCGCGGAVKDGVIEIQGDHRDMLLAELAAQGHKVKRVGA